jgi:hypothetical protein
MELLWVGPERGAERDLVEAQMTALGYARHEWRRVGSVEEALTVSDTPSAAWRLVAVGDVVLLRRYDLSAVTAGAPPDARRLVLDAAAAAGSSETSGGWRRVGASAGDSRLFATRACAAEPGLPGAETAAEPGAEYAFRWSLAGGPPTSDAEDAALAALARAEPPLSPPARHLSFWGGFADTCPHFLERVIRGATRGAIPDGGRVTFVSVFPNRLPLGLGADDGGLRVAFSGEVYSQDASAFDLNLIMEATDAARRTVCCPLFSYFAYHCSGMSAGFNSWPLLARPRPRPPAPRPRFCATTVSNPNGAERNRFIEKLAAAAAARTQHGRVDSMGAVMNNCGGRRLPHGAAGRAELGAYRFVVCFENTFASHYLTEKLLEAWVAGAVPIYGGASMAREWLNPDAFLQLEDASEAGMDRLVARVMELDADPVAYEAMRALPLLRGPGAPAPLSVEGMAEAAAAVLATRATR